ncbi:MAG TPA: 2OG-Fe(II) oxygenase family protein [Candidatus Nanoarchaeia archaeon]|nr:2OG-Fe(II) oxygenase family protein [Candidatus Nanoarchaeia archaeon]
MEIPTVKIGLYKENQPEFTHQIKQALENIGVLQINGLNQLLVDCLYEYIQKNITKFPPERKYLGKCFYQHNFYLLPSENLRESTEDKPVAERDFVDSLMRTININVSEIVDTVYDHDDFSYLKIKYPEPILIGYRKGPKMISRDNRKKMMIREHSDNTRFTCAASASAPGLEGLFKGRWVPLQPEPGHILLWGGKDLKLYSNGKVKPLFHRVLYPASERWALLFV